MSDLIDRQAAIDAFDGNIVVNGKENADRIMECLRVVIGRIKALPSVQPKVDCQKCIFCGFPGFKQFQTAQPENEQPTIELRRKKGTWIPLVDIPWYRCSECGAVRKNTAFMEYFCPNCGADMRGDSDEAD